MPGRVKRIHTFPDSINPRVNVNAHLEFELAYLEVTIQRASHDTTKKEKEIPIGNIQ